MVSKKLNLKSLILAALSFVSLTSPLGAPAQVAGFVGLAGFYGFGAPAQASVPSSGSAVMSFKEWKASRITEAKSALEAVSVAATAAALNVEHSDARTGGRPSQMQLNLEVAQELTIEDYLLAYLRPLKDDAAIREAAAKMTQEEIGGLIIAMRNQIGASESRSCSPGARFSPQIASSNPHLAK